MEKLNQLVKQSKKSQAKGEILTRNKKIMRVMKRFEKVIEAVIIFIIRRKGKNKMREKLSGYYKNLRN